MVTDAQLIYGLPRGMPKSRPNLYVPEGWGETWLRARAEASTRPVIVGLIGDSVGKGTDASPQFNRSWPGILRSRLQARHGDGGSGFVTTDLAGTPHVVATGAWTTAPGFGVPSRGGPGGVSWRPTVAGNGATLTYTVRGSSLAVLLKTAPSFGTFNVSVDGGPDTPVALNSAVSVLSHPVTGLTSGDHTVRVTATTGNGEVFGVTGRNPTGVILDNWSGGGASITVTASFGLLTPTVSGTGSPTFASDTLAQMGVPDVFMLALGVNDVLAAAPTQESISDALTYVFGRVMAQGATDSYPPDLIVVLEHGGKVDTLLDAAVEYSQVVAQVRQAAMGVGAAIVDVWGAGRRSWQAWADQGYWGSGNADTVHPSNAGHDAYADLIWPLFDW